MMVMDDFLEPHNLRCRNCHNVFVTVLSINSVEQGRVHCPKCRGITHEILDEARIINIFMREYYIEYSQLGEVTFKKAWEDYKSYCANTNIEYDIPQYKFREELKEYFESFEEYTKDLNGNWVRNLYRGLKKEKIYLDEKQPTRNTSSDMYDSLLYALQAKNKFDMEDENMKRTENEEMKDKNILITRRCDTSRGVFTVEQLEPTDLFVCIGDEKQTIYMAVKDLNNEPKYKTRKPVVNMETGELHYFDNSTKIYVYHAGCELRVGDFLNTSEGYICDTINDI